MQPENILIQSGLSEEQAATYQALLEKGPQKASSLASWVGIKRGLIYKVLEQLEFKGLVTKNDGPGTVAVYSPAHPSRLVDILETQEKEAILAKETVTANLGAFLSQFNLQHDKPGVQFFEGIRGLERLWADIISEKTDMCLIQSPDDRKHPDIAVKIPGQIKKQVTANIHVRAITPIVSDTLEWLEHYDAENLVTRHIVPHDRFGIPAQIIIYGKNKVGITSFHENMITTIVEDPAIHETFRIMFEYIWSASATDHQAFLGRTTPAV